MVEPFGSKRSSVQTAGAFGSACHGHAVQGDALDPGQGWRERLRGATGVVSTLGAFGSNEFMYKVSEAVERLVAVQSTAAARCASAAACLRESHRLGLLCTTAHRRLRLPPTHLASQQALLVLFIACLLASRFAARPTCE
jgi:hypothetical protein